MGLKKAVSLWGLIAFAAIIIFATVSCNIPSNPQPEPFIISFRYITGVAKPETGEIPVTKFDNNEQYSGTVTWSPAVNGTFAHSTEYTATITLTPKPGYTLKGVPANCFSAPGWVSRSNAANSGVVTIKYPDTGKSVITKRNIEGLTVPIIGEIPVTAITENEQYSGTVEWSPEVNGTFADGIKYWATITITPKAGYILPSRPANDFFTVEGARVSHKDGYIFEATFPPTGKTINIADIQGLDTPVIYGIPVTDIFENAQYTGTVEWSPEVNGTFAASTVYTATVSITPKTGYTLLGVTADFFSVWQAASASNAASSGIVTVIFPRTDTVIDTAAIQGLTVPTAGGIPVAGITETAQYTGTVTWSPSVYGTFAASTVYTATIDLRPKTGYTTQGTAADFFTVEGAATVGNTVNYNYNSTYSIVTVTFPPTGIPADRFEYYWVDQHGSLVTDSSSSIILNAGKTLHVTALGDGYNVKQWYLNGINTGQSANTFIFSSATSGEHTLSLIVEKDGKFYNTNITIKVLKE